MNNLEKIFSESPSGRDYAKGYMSYLSQLLANLDVGTIEEVIDVFQVTRNRGKTIFLIGNGGSAATCSHFALGLCCLTKGRFRALSLTDNSAYMTALGNDEGYENIFAGQMKALFCAGDVLVAISGSGNSLNLIKAIEYANNNGGITIGIVGFNGGRLKNICRHCVHVKTGEYGPVEDIHLMLIHLITTYLALKNG